MRFIKPLYITTRFFIFIWAIVLLFVLGYFIPVLLFPAKLSFFILIILFGIDIYILLNVKKGVFALRQTPNRLSNGDDNEIKIHIENFYRYEIKVKIIDELPFQFQERNFCHETKLFPCENKVISYKLKPLQRGEYCFGFINTYISSPINLAVRRFKFQNNMVVPVYPSYFQMKKYELLAVSNRLTETGVKRIRKIGHSTEFEQIKDYILGDDYRTINWKATARNNKMMVNHYDEEKSQQVYNVINIGRVMKMPFSGMSLLDYAINTSLVISKVAIRKHDKAGIITFSDKINTVLPADNRSNQMLKILDLLYKQTTNFLESDYEILCTALLSKINHRSLIILYTSFETLESLKRQLPFLRKLAVNHLVVVIFFENTELHSLLKKDTKSIEDIYIKTIAEKFAFEKRLIVKELNRYKIHSILTSPEKLSVNTINKYLEIKARTLI